MTVVGNEDVLARLERLEADTASAKAERARLEAENERLRARLFDLESRQRPAQSPGKGLDEPVSRRGLLGKLGAAGAAAAGATVLLARPAGAANGDALVWADTNTGTNGVVLNGNISNPAHATLTVLRLGNGTAPALQGVTGYNSITTGLGAGVRGNAGSGTAGVIGTSPDAPGVFGASTLGDAVYGRRGAASGVNPLQYAGVRGDGTNGAAGVIGTGSAEGVIGMSTSAFGVKGVSSTKSGLFGQTGTPSAQFGPPETYPAGVTGSSRDTYGVVGVSDNAVGSGGISQGGVGVFGFSSTKAGVHGSAGYGEDDYSNAGLKCGVKGNGNHSTGVVGTSLSGNGVYGYCHHANAGVLGYSVESSGLASSGPNGGRLLLTPSVDVGPPATGYVRAGELARDWAGTLWLCTASGSPGTWVQALTSGLNDLGAASATLQSDSGNTLFLTNTGTSGSASYARINNAESSASCLRSATQGTGRALYAQVLNEANTVPAAEARTVGTGPAMFGISGNPAGRGGQFQGGAAQVRLMPASGSHPASGQAGDLFVDGAKDLWFCKGGTTWVRLG